MKKPKVSIAQVAQEAGVSNMTVSRVVRGEPFVKEETRTRVMRIMRELGYVPPAAARSLRATAQPRQPGTRLFALVFGRGTESSVTFFHDISLGVERAAPEFGLCPIHLMLPESPESSWPRLRTLFSLDSLCGALLAGQFSQDIIAFIRGNVKNIVMIDGPAPQLEGVGSVESGNLEGSLMALDHLIGIGCRKVLVITVEPEHYFGRAMAMAAQARRAGADVLDVQAGCLTGRQACDMVLELWRAGRRYDGIFTTDDFAIGAIQAFRQLGVRVPQQVKVVGFDDIGYAPFLAPSLTSIRIDKLLLGSEAVHTLVALTHSPEKATGIKKVIRPSLIVRESTGGPPLPQPDPLHP